MYQIKSFLPCIKAWETSTFLCGDSNSVHETTYLQSRLEP